MMEQIEGMVVRRYTQMGGGGNDVPITHSGAFVKKVAHFVASFLALAASTEFLTAISATCSL